MIEFQERNTKYIYPYTLKEAERLGDVSLWRESHDENIACRDDIAKRLSSDFDGKKLDPDCAKKLIDIYGFRRVEYVLTNTVRLRKKDGRLSEENREFGGDVQIPKNISRNLDLNTEFCLHNDIGLINILVNQYKKAFGALNLFVHKDCVKDSKTLDYENKVLVVSKYLLREDSWNPKNQLWLATGGFGCSPTSSGRAVFAISLGTGERSRWDRTDFAGILKEEKLPDWAKEKLSEITSSLKEKTAEKPNEQTLEI